MRAERQPRRMDGAKAQPIPRPCWDLPVDKSLLAMTLANIVARMEPTGRANARPMTGSAKSGNHATPAPDCASLHPGYSRRDLPVRQFCVESYFLFSEKYFCSHGPQINSRTLAIPSH